MIPHNQVRALRSDARAVARTVLSGQWAQGPRVAELEGRLADMAGVAHAVCVGSGLAALRLALKGLGVGAQDRVLIPAYCCVALPNAVLSLGGIPQPVDIQAGTWNIDPDLCGERPGGKAIVAVNTFGYPADVSRLERDAPVIEDSSHAFGSVVEGRPFGGRSQVAVLSFYATKLLGAGEGGAVLTQDHGLAAMVREWRDYSDKAPDGSRLNDKMTDLEATLALCQLDRLPAMLAERRRLAEVYQQGLEQLVRRGLMRLPPDHPARTWYRYPIESLRLSAAELIRRLSHEGIEAVIPVTPWTVPNQTVASRAYQSVVSLPLYPWLAAPQQAAVMRALERVLTGLD